MNREVNPNHRTANHLCDPTRLRAETRRTQGHPVPRGGFHKAGEGPAFGGSLVTFCHSQKVTPAERPRLGRWFAPEKWSKSKAFLFTINKARSTCSGPCVLIQEKKPPLCKGRWPGVSRVGGIDRLTAQVPACQPGGDASRWGVLLSGQKNPKPV